MYLTPHTLALMPLGRLPSPPDPRTIQFTTIVKKYLPEPPQNFTAWKGQKLPPGWGNESYGDCVVAARANIIYVQAILDRQVPPRDDSLAITEYLRLSEGDDNGLDMLTTLKEWRTRPWLTGQPLYAFAKIDPKNPLIIKQSLASCLNLFIGVQMPRAWQRTTTWTVGHGRDFRPGTWGSHCVELHAYTNEWVELFSWGSIFHLTWEALALYCDESYVMIDGLTGQANEHRNAFVDLDMLKDVLADVALAPNDLY